MVHFQKKNWIQFWSLQLRKLALFEQNLKTYNLPKYFQKQKQHAEIHCRSWANTNHAIKNEWKQFLGPQNTLLAVKKKIWGKLEHDILCQFSGLVNGTRLAPFFCLILMKKGQNYKEQLLTLSCIRVDSSQIKTKTQQNHFGAKFVKLLFLYIFSVFSSYLPK